MAAAVPEKASDVDAVCTRCGAGVGQTGCRYSTEPVKKLEPDADFEDVWYCHAHLERVEQHSAMADLHPSEEYEH